MELADVLYMGPGASSNPVNRADPRVKVVFVLVCLLLVLLSPSVWTPLYFVALSLFLVAVADVSLSLFVIRLVAPFAVIGALIFIQMFFYGSTPLWTTGWPWGGRLVLYREGFFRGLTLAARVGGGVSLIILLSLTSSVLSILSSLRWFRVPRLWLEILFISYRYLFVLLKHLTNGYQAQRSRLGYATLRSAVGSVGTLSAHLFLHVFDQTAHTYEAMRLRGYRECFPLPAITGRWSGEEALLAVLLALPGLVLLWA